jgi:hypothetical protein
MSRYEVLLLLHVLSAFALIGAQTAFWGITLATRPGRELLTPAAGMALARPANVVVIAGTAGTLIFGVWLAIDLDGYELWDGWIIASLAFWAFGTATGIASGNAFARAGEGAAFWRRGLLLLALSTIGLLMVLFLMIFKPGA